ncbi:DUF1320 domain-containing protein [Pseudoalteromonas fuliginea]|uniref:DUF1320 domain-containing protein n=2 Tax=Bacteria TaxID=2 RepID=A0AB73BMD2_9GAMM|nr:phage protein Gp36 family protein [Pseudoalteromonas fuliginea]KAA1165480.1 DUF1320 domain-containing protein [Pseudoalteromonas fuliginea]
MSYASTNDMQKRFGQQDLVLLTEREDSDPEQINMPILEQALTDASAEINGYLAGRYSLPLTIVPTVLTRLCCDIARYFLGTDNAPEHITERYQNAIKFLVAVGKGTLSLGVDELGANAQTDDTAVMQSAGSVFARGKSKGFI